AAPRRNAVKTSPTEMVRIIGWSSLSPAPAMTWKLDMAVLRCLLQRVFAIRPSRRVAVDERSRLQGREYAGNGSLSPPFLEIVIRAGRLDFVAIRRVPHRAVEEIVEVGRAGRTVQILRRHADKSAGEAAMRLM